MNNTDKYINLLNAEKKAKKLFDEILLKNFIEPGITENKLSSKIHNLAFDMFGIKQYWHKRIVRSGINTLCPYKENPINLVIQKDDILFLDFGPIFDGWEADLGRTYVLGKDPIKLKLLNDVEECWHITHSYFNANKNMTASELYKFVCSLAEKRSWEFGNEHSGHLIGAFPHSKIDGDNFESYIHPKNHLILKGENKNGDKLEWILEIHFISQKYNFGGFFEQLLTRN